MKHIWRGLLAAVFACVAAVGALAQGGAIGKPQPLSAQMICDALGYCPGQGTWYALSRAPLSSEGRLGDLWLRTDTSDVYKRGTSTWSIVSNIKGQTGTAGATWSSGSGAPSGGAGVNGDHYFRTDTGQVYLKSGGAWSSIANLTGATGATGAAGGNAYTTTSGAFIMPAVSSTVSVGVGTTSWMVAGQMVYVGTAGYMSVSSITNGTTVVLKNEGASVNASPTTTILLGAGVTPSGTVPTATINSGTAGQFGYYTGTNTISPATLGNGLALSGSTLNGPVPPPRGRLTLQSATPVMSTNQTAKSTIYYDCYNGTQVPVYDGTSDVVLSIGSCEISTTMQTSGTGVTNSGGVFDVWGFSDSGTLTLCVATNGSGGGWASDTGGSNAARGTGYSQLDRTTRGYITNKNAITNCYNGSTNKGSISANRATYLGTLYTTAAGQTGMNVAPAAASGGSNAVLGLYNAYNRLPVRAAQADSTGSWTYASTTIRSANGSTANRISFVDGLQESSIDCMFQQYFYGAGVGAQTYIGVGLDSTTVFSGMVVTQYTAGNPAITNQVRNSFLPQLGFHYLQALEKSDGANSAFSGHPNMGLLVTLEM